MNDLDPSIDDARYKLAFKHFGEIKSAKVAVDDRCTDVPGNRGERTLHAAVARLLLSTIFQVAGRGSLSWSVIVVVL